jgi:hypothetical protein
VVAGWGHGCLLGAFLLRALNLPDKEVKAQDSIQLVSV